MSPAVQALPSVHAMVFATYLHPVALSQLSVVQRILSSQMGAGPPTHAPAEQASAVVQALLSVQPSELLTYLQPDAGSQLSVVQTLPSSQFGAAPPTHLPPPHKSLVVQAFPSEQTTVLLATWQDPVAVLQLSSVHGLLSLHVLAAPGTHLPTVQTSLSVHALLSEQAAVLFT